MMRVEAKLPPLVNAQLESVKYAVQNSEDKSANSGRRTAQERSMHTGAALVSVPKAKHIDI